MSAIQTLMFKRTELEEVRQCIVSGSYADPDLYELCEYENKLEDEVIYLEEYLQIGRN